MSIDETMRAAFDGVNANDPDAIVACWNPASAYDNPMVGPAATGRVNLQASMVKLCDGVQSRGQLLVVDRITSGDRHVVAE